MLFELAGEVNKTNDAHLAGCLKALGGIIGVLQRDPIEFLQGGAVSDGLSNEEIEDLIARRKQRARIKTGQNPTASATF